MELGLALSLQKKTAEEYSSAVLYQDLRSTFRTYTIHQTGIDDQT
jgi:hypothetical protein